MRREVSRVAEAIKRAVPSAEVYLIGGAAEDKLTALSDMDILVALDRQLSHQDRVSLGMRIMEALDEAGIHTTTLPLDVHIETKSEIARYKTRIRIL